MLGEPAAEDLADPKNFALAFLGGSTQNKPKGKGSMDDALESFETAALADKDSIPKTQIQKCLKEDDQALEPAQKKDKSKPELVEGFETD